MRDRKTSAIILAGGVGSRMNSDKPKQFMEILGKTVISRCVCAFDRSELVDEIVVVVKEDEFETAEKLLESDIKNKPWKLVNGGACRAESAKNGFYAVSSDVNYVAIHDAARCLVTPDMIDKTISAAHIHGAATAVCNVSDTVKLVDKNGKIVSTIPREQVFRAQTPQVFSKSLYSKAMESCQDLASITDDNMLVENIGGNIFAVDLGPSNIKITTADDILLAKKILAERGEGSMCGFRIGHGYDVHQLVEGRRLIIGGVDIPYEKGLLGHSDADVLLHAIMDSLLGAAGLGDIGKHFPDTNEKYKGVSSLHLLTLVADLLRSKDISVVNVDATLVMQRPKISSYVPKMISNIAFALGITEDRVNVKATTEEHLGFTGRGEGASAHAVSMISIN